MHFYKIFYLPGFLSKQGKILVLILLTRDEFCAMIQVEIDKKEVLLCQVNLRH